MTIPMTMTWLFGHCDHPCLRAHFCNLNHHDAPTHSFAQVSNASLVWPWAHLTSIMPLDLHLTCIHQINYRHPSLSLACGFFSIEFFDLVSCLELNSWFFFLDPLLQAYCCLLDFLFLFFSMTTIQPPLYFFCLFFLALQIQFVVSQIFSCSSHEHQNAFL